MDISSFFSWQNLFNLIDILIVWALIFNLLKVLRSSRTLNILNGIFFVLLVKLIAMWFQLQTLDWIMNTIIQWGAIGLIVVFQPEIRKGLERIGGNLFRSSKTTNYDSQESMINEIIKSAQYNSKRRIGALISIETGQSLTEIARTGIPLDAEITSALLINIFVPNTPLHDGAVIIQNFRITSAASFLPLSEDPKIPKELGTRHRAAIGLSEQTDAVTVIVSEETGEVSITYKGNHYRNLDEESMRILFEKCLPISDIPKAKFSLRDFFNSDEEE